MREREGGEVGNMKEENERNEKAKVRALVDGGGPSLSVFSTIRLKRKFERRKRYLARVYIYIYI